MNALAAAAVGWVLERPIEEIAASLRKFEPAKMRMEIVPHASGARFINDAYNANPASMSLSVRSLLESYPSSKKVLVLGSMLELGPDSEKLHFHLGAEIGKLPLEKIYLYGSEMVSAKEGATAAGAASGKVELVASHEELAEKLQKHLEPNTVILVKGSRGTRMETVLQLALASSPARRS